MRTFRAYARSQLWMAALCLLGARAIIAAQTSSLPRTPSTNGYRIAGTVVSKTDGHALGRARVTVRDTKDPQKFESVVTADDGKFEFTGVPAGKYSLTGAKRGFIAASYEQHDQYSTAIVTGADLETEALVLRLAPAAVISGKILDESGEPVRRATVTLYYKDHNSGVDQIHQARGAQTNDLGEYEIASLMPGTYFLSASAQPWYAVHPQSDMGRQGKKKEPDPPENFDRSLDVAYPLTYYADVTDTDGATPIQVRGGERLQLEIHLNPVPSLHLLFRVPVLGNGGYAFPQLKQPTFDGSTYFGIENPRMISPGLIEITGVPAGRYDIRISGSGGATEMNGVDLVKDGEEIDTHHAEALSTIKFSVQVLGEATLPARLSVGLRSEHRRPAGGRMLDGKGEAELDQIAPGKYEVTFWGPPRPYSIARMSAEGAIISGNSLTVGAGASATVTLTLVGGSSRIEGTARRAGKAVAGAMVLLVPKDPEVDHTLFRRDQSDLDGTFALQNVVPGSYTVVAIEDGWELDWSRPEVIAPYLNHGQKIQVGGEMGKTIKLEDVEVQSK